MKLQMGSERFKKILLVLLMFTLTIGEEKLFYDSKNIILYNIDLQGIKITKEKVVDVEKLGDLRKILQDKNIKYKKDSIKNGITFIDYNAMKNEYNVYIQIVYYSIDGGDLGFPQVTYIKAVYDEEFNLINIEKKPTYIIQNEKFEIKDFSVTITGDPYFIDINSENLKYSKIFLPTFYLNKEQIFLAVDKNEKAILSYKNVKGINNKMERNIFFPNLVSSKKNFLIGMNWGIYNFGVNKSDENENVLYKLDLNNDRITKIFEFDSTWIQPKTLINQDEDLLYESLYRNKSEKKIEINILNLKTKKIKKMNLSSEMIGKIYSSYEIQGVSEEQIEKFKQIK